MENVSIYAASGSSRYEQYFVNCLFSREANKSISVVNLNLFIAIVHRMDLTSIHLHDKYFLIPYLQ